MSEEEGGELNFKINMQDKPIAQYGATNDVLYLWVTYQYHYN